MTKYEALRSFRALKPPRLSPLNYENAALYTNALLDTYMGYESLYKNVSSDIFAVQSGQKRFRKLASESTTRGGDSTKSKLDFSRTVSGLVRLAKLFDMK